MPTPRLQRIKETYVPKYFSGDGFIKPIHLSVLRNRYYTESWKETEGEPISIRRAKAFVHWLDHMPIFIRPDELIVGFYADDPHVLDWGLEVYEPGIFAEYIKAGYAKKDEIDEWDDLIKYWEKRNLNTVFKSLITEEEDNLSKVSFRVMEVRPTQYTSRTQPDHDLYMEVGVRGIIKRLNDRLQELEAERSTSRGGREAIDTALKLNDVKAMIVAAEGFLRWTNRYSLLAIKMAGEEQDPSRKEELKRISEICAHVPGNPARTFWEALQSHWFSFLAYNIIELLCHGTSLRLDQIFWPFYRKDVLVEHRLERGKALELMENLLLHVDELGRPLSLHRRKALQGSNYLATYTIGGVHPKTGEDACNELTILILDAIDDLKLNHPDFKFRWHQKVDPKVWRRVVEVVRSGLGHPSIKNDPIVIAGLMNHYGFTLEEARSWAVVGCISPAPTIHWGRYRRDAWSIRVAKILELTLFNGLDPIPYEDGKLKEIGPKTGDVTQFTTFDQLFEAFRMQIASALQKSAHIKVMADYANSTVLKRPFASCLFHRSLDSSRDIMDCPEKGMPWVNDPGKIDAIDSLIGLKKLVFEEKRYGMAEVLDALRKNWEDHEEMRRAFVNAPKFGNDDDFADEVAVQVFDMIADEMSKVRDITGASPMPSGLVVTNMFLLAPYTGALPNGRKLGDPLADGGINPCPGYERKGPMSAVLSAAKIDSLRQKANIFNQKFSPSSVEGENGLRKLQNYIETAMHLGLDMIQFNVVDAATLRAAQSNPGKYPDLVVRVSGYNARFVELDRFVQESIISRAEHGL